MSKRRSLQRLNDLEVEEARKSPPKSLNQIRLARLEMGELVNDIDLDKEIVSVLKAPTKNGRTKLFGGKKK